MENEFLRVTLDPARCGIKSIVDKKTGRELVNRRSPYALGQYLYERFDSDQGHAFTRAYVKPNAWGEIRQPKQAQDALGQRASLSGGHGRQREAGDCAASAVSATALLKAAPRGIIPDATQLRVTLYAGKPWLDLEWSIANKTPDPWPEGGWLCFPLRADDPRFQLARLGSIVDPAQDLVPGSNHEIFCLNGGLLVRGADGGRTGICPVDSQLVSLEHPGLWRYSRDFVAHKPDVFVMLFNNVYSTNFAQWSEGSWSSRVRLWATEQDQSSEDSLIGGSWEARVGCLAAVADGAAGKLPPAAAGVVVARSWRTANDGSTAVAGLQSRSARHSLWPQPLRGGNAVAALGPGGRLRPLRGPFARGDAGPQRSLAICGASRLGRRSRFRAGPVRRDDPAHGPGELHPFGADGGVATLSRGLYSRQPL